MKKRWPLKIGRVVLIVAVAAFVLGFVVMSLWNALVPELFHGPTLTYWQAIGLTLLARILFGGGGPGRAGGGWRRERMRQRFEERMASMTPEEREKLRQRMGDRCDWGEDGMPMRGRGRRVEPNASQDA